MKRAACGPTADVRKAEQPGRKLRILVVANHPDMRLGLEVYLASLGHRPQCAESIQTALAVARTSDPFDLLLSDTQLPDGDGWELPNLLAQSGDRPSHAIAMTGFGRATDNERSHAAGFRAHLVKPGAPGELAAALHEISRL